jgi:hypothetical protein
MALVWISTIRPLKAFHVEITLTTGEVVRRDLLGLLANSIFDPIRADEDLFRRVRVEAGTLVWPGGIDLCPDVVIWGGLPPDSDSSAAGPAA